MEEIDILYSVHDALYSSAMDSIALAIDVLFKFEIFWFAVALVLLMRRTTRTVGSVLLMAIILEILTVYMLKFGVNRVRPVIEYDIDGLVTSFNTSSFPSGHAAQWFCAATVFAMFRKDSVPFMFLLACFVAVTRMYLFVHYPTDVLAGALIGIACAFLSAFLLLRPGPRTVYKYSGKEETAE